METFMKSSMNQQTAGPSPELCASTLSILTWQWLQPFISRGNRAPLKTEDLYEMNPRESTQHCEQLWRRAVEKAKQSMDDPNTYPSVWKLLWACFGMEYARAAICKLIWLVGVILQVYILKAIIIAVADEDKFNWWWATLLILGTMLMFTVISLSLQMCFILSEKVGMKIRSTVSMTVFDKLLRMKLASLVGISKGLILNLVTNDTQKLLEAATCFNFAWFALVEVATISALAIAEIGVSALPGVAIAFITPPLQAWVAHLSGQLRSKAVKYTDTRVHLIGEIFNGIKIIKYNGWTTPFLHRLADIRKTEMSIIRRALFLRAATFTIRESFPILASLATFGTYYAIHKGIFMSPSKAFTALALFNIFGRSLSIAPLDLKDSKQLEKQLWQCTACKSC